ncbi:MAG: CHASE4 domain-containing protein [Methanoregula sp.]|jgi:sensor domain CHASE-containing protein
MKIQTRTLIILGITVFVLVFALNLISQFFILASYQNVEEDNSVADINRVTSQISFETIELSRSVRDSSIWNRSYEFMETRNEDFLENDILPVATYENLQINGILLFDSNRNLVAGQWYDLHNRTRQEIPRSLLLYFQDNPAVLANGSVDGEKTGFIQLPEGAVLVSMHTILPGTGTGSGQGTLVMVRLFDEGRIQSLENRSALRVYMTSLVSDPGIPGLETCRESMDSCVIVTIPQNDSIISGYTALPDISGKPTLLVRVDKKRAMYPQIQATILFMIISSVLLGLLVILVTVVLLHHYITKPLGDLDGILKEIGKNHDISVRLTGPGDDEITSLHTSLNTMLAELQDAEKELAARDKALVEANRKATMYLDIYLDVLTYEIMNSTLAIRGFADLIQQGVDEASANSYARRISDITQRNREIISNIETISKIFKQPPKKVPVNLLAAFRKAAGSFSGLEIVCNNCNPTVFADDMLVTVFDNLISNSIKFGGKTVRIEVSTRDIGGNMTEVTVADNGPGIPGSYKAGIFDRFQRGSDRRSSYGLGLHIAKMVIEAYGGRIWADDRVAGKPGEGAAIRFTLKKTDPVSGS